MGLPPGYTILIDGYNAIKRHRAWEPLPIQETRSRLIQLVDHTRWPIPIASIRIIFDGPVSEDSPQNISQLLRVQFASPSADTVITQSIRTSQFPSRILLISDDGELLRIAKSHGAKHQPTNWLFQQRVPSARPLSKTGHAEKISPPARTARQITEELAKRWLGPPS